MASCQLFMLPLLIISYSQYNITVLKLVSIPVAAADL